MTGLPTSATLRRSRNDLCLGLLVAGAICTLLLAAVFVWWPGLDLAISGFFGGKDTGFPVAASPTAIATRWVFRISAHLVFIVSLLWLALDLVRDRRGRERRFALIFASAVYAIGPGLLVNFGLKSHYGRARPRDIQFFGGDAVYTPFWLPADQCAANCSFVSGEASVSSAAALVLLIIFLPSLRPMRRMLCVAIAGGFVVGASFWRVVLGAHFASDVTFAVALMTMVVPAIWLILDRIESRVGLGG